MAVQENAKLMLALQATREGHRHFPIEETPGSADWANYSLTLLQL